MKTKSTYNNCYKQYPHNPFHVVNCYLTYKIPHYSHYIHYIDNIILVYLLIKYIGGNFIVKLSKVFTMSLSYEICMKTCTALLADTRGTTNFHK